MFHSLSYKNQIVGYTAQIKDCQIFYGTRYLKRSDLRDVFPNYKLCFVKQVHGSRIVSAQDKIPLEEADGHWTEETNTALVIQTADCLPVFLWDEKIICGLHIGWKGVEKQIILKAFEYFLKKTHLEASCGPCINEEHFEIGLDVAQRLIASSPNGKKWVKNINNGHYHASLIHLVQDQIESQIPLKKWYLFNKNTFSEKIFYSYRRTAEKKIGQYSFIVRV